MSSKVSIAVVKSAIHVVLVWNWASHTKQQAKAAVTLTDPKIVQAFVIIFLHFHSYIINKTYRFLMSLSLDSDDIL